MSSLSLYVYLAGTMCNRAVANKHKSLMMKRILHVCRKSRRCIWICQSYVQNTVAVFSEGHGVFTFSQRIQI